MRATVRCRLKLESYLPKVAQLVEHLTVISGSLVRVQPCGIIFVRYGSFKSLRGHHIHSCVVVRRACKPVMLACLTFKSLVKSPSCAWVLGFQHARAVPHSFAWDGTTRPASLHVTSIGRAGTTSAWVAGSSPARAGVPFSPPAGVDASPRVPLHESAPATLLNLGDRECLIPNTESAHTDS